ncbi:Mur ligase family protein [Campylobacter californiensis]|uniref:Mur ligase family protein n=1 Tax=Campylobacter californiensis TaxID=1032243 RepID=UPI0014732DBD|nr:UDP-N-acetylmuramoyl-tripeptide--D-alanyl-D-alanine ligase [Campylobacter sp. RM12916]MBE3609327.1 UDP-N-acetylmuramoyl-tripeptide--D-alanyl-D-alanine ligase [Campylobacter sp. RM12916]
MSLEELFFNVSKVFFIYAISFYTITCFQWFSYRFERVVFHFTKPLWHVFFAIVPLVLFYTTGEYFYIYFYFAYLPSLYLWHKKLDKKLVFTARIKRFFIFLTLAVVSFGVMNFIINGKFDTDVLLIIAASLVLSHFYEKINALNFRKKADKKLALLPELKIILITASYGKTSIKNFLFELLRDDFICHKTPRSVNTLTGLIKDVNENLTSQTQIYIAEAGARLKGDIAQITEFLNPHIVVVGEIGAQHIEYFKSLENIRSTKLEALCSKRLEAAFLHSSTLQNPDDKQEIYDESLSDVKADFSGLNFILDSKSYHANLLGKFNAVNLAACIKVAKFLGVSEEKIDKNLSKIKNVEHRLQKIEAGGKLIIDDSFNGNFAGMSASYELVSTFEGRKVLITPGIVESSPQENERLGRIINEIFDVVMISSPLNAQALLKSIIKPQIIIIKDKANMQEILAKNTKIGDVILFSNDAPSFM